MNIIPLSNHMGGEPRIFLLERAITPEQCEAAIGAAKQYQAPAMVFSPDGSGKGVHLAKSRTGTHAFLSKDHLAIHRLVGVALLFSGQTLKQVEPVQISHYETLDRYNLHHDAFKSEAECRGAGQRIWSAVAYLNDVEDGGGTEFPHLGIRLNATRGNMVVWENLGPDGLPDKRMLHAALPPVTGEKWSAAVWIREREAPR